MASWWKCDLCALLTAATFAESGESQTAIEMLRERGEAPESARLCDRHQPAAVEVCRRDPEGSDG